MNLGLPKTFSMKSVSPSKKDKNFGSALRRKKLYNFQRKHL